MAPSPSVLPSALTAADVEELIREGVPLVGAYGITVAEIAGGRVVMRMPYKAEFVRPGGTVTGPAMFGLADVALYAAVLSLIGRVEMAVTTSMTINFLKRPAQVEMRAEARVLKLGKRLAYGEVLIFSNGSAEPVAHATGAYSTPPHAPVNVGVSGYHSDDV